MKELISLGAWDIEIQTMLELENITLNWTAAVPSKVVWAIFCGDKTRA